MDQFSEWKWRVFLKNITRSEDLKQFTNSTQHLTKQKFFNSLRPLPPPPPAWHRKYNYTNFQVNLGYLGKDYMAALKSIYFH